jgi:hypothetical protein
MSPFSPNVEPEYRGEILMDQMLLPNRRVFFTVILVLFSMSIMSCGLLVNRKAEAATTFNRYLGKHKDEFIKKNGPPTSCVNLASGEETCEWTRGGMSGGGSYSANTGYGGSSVSTWEHRIIYTYDRDHMAREWSYRGALGAFSNADYPDQR